MKIGILAERAQVSRDTIRYYERLGLLKASRRHENNGYKEYSDSTLQRLHKIRFAKRLGFTLTEIRECIESWMRNEYSPGSKANHMAKKRREIRAKIAELREIESALSAQILQQVSE